MPLSAQTGLIPWTGMMGPENRTGGSVIQPWCLRCVSKFRSVRGDDLPVLSGAVGRREQGSPVAVPETPGSRLR
jgi:hypothetical protein